MKKEPIDIVIPWVDGSEPEWIKLFNEYAPKEFSKSTDARKSRYEEYGLLKYWFRAIEKNASWVRKVHFITNGQKPAWLNENAPKLNWVKHDDYMNPEYLPTFSSHPIELNFHKIKDLTENFVYFNDDIYLLNKVNPDYFFKNNLPVMRAAATIRWLKFTDFFSKIVYNDVYLINKFFTYKRVVLNNPIKWFFMNPIKCNIANIVFSTQNYIPGFTTQHQANSYKKSTLQEVWNNCYDILEKTSLNRFRTVEDVNQYIFYFWQLCKGCFYPKKDNYSKYFVVSEENYPNIKKCFYNKTKLLCLNDNDDKNCKEIYDLIIQLFEEKFSSKSSFEI